MSPFEQVEHINRYCEIEEQIAAFHLPTFPAMEQLTGVAYSELILENFDGLIST